MEGRSPFTPAGPLHALFPFGPFLRLPFSGCFGPGETLAAGSSDKKVIISYCSAFPVCGPLLAATV